MKIFPINSKNFFEKPMNRPLYNILTNGWGERFLSELEETQKENLKITSLRNMLNENYNDYTSFFKLKKYSKEFPIIHMNSWFDIFLLWKKSDNKIIFESHALHPGFDNIHARAIIESRLIRLFVWMF